MAVEAGVTAQKHCVVASGEAGDGDFQVEDGIAGTDRQWDQCRVVVLEWNDAERIVRGRECHREVAGLRSVRSVLP